jgi:hypothetical protein
LEFEPQADASEVPDYVTECRREARAVLDVFTPLFARRTQERDEARWREVRHSAELATACRLRDDAAHAADTHRRERDEALKYKRYAEAGEHIYNAALDMLGSDDPPVTAEEAMSMGVQSLAMRLRRRWSALREFARGASPDARLAATPDATQRMRRRAEPARVTTPEPNDFDVCAESWPPKPAPVEPSTDVEKLVILSREAKQAGVTVRADGESFEAWAMRVEALGIRVVLSALAKTGEKMWPCVRGLEATAIVADWDGVHTGGDEQGGDEQGGVDVVVRHVLDATRSSLAPVLGALVVRVADLEKAVGISLDNRGGSPPRV